MFTIIAHCPEPGTSINIVVEKEEGKERIKESSVLTIPLDGELSHWSLYWQTQIQVQKHARPSTEAKSNSSYGDTTAKSSMTPLLWSSSPISSFPISHSSRAPLSLPPQGLPTQRAFVFQLQAPSVVLFLLEKQGESITLCSWLGDHCHSSDFKVPTVISSLKARPTHIFLQPGNGEFPSFF